VAIVSRYHNLVVRRRAPFVTNVARASELITDLVVLRERLFRVGLIQTAQAMEAAERKAGFELADHLQLVERKLKGRR